MPSKYISTEKELSNIIKLNINWLEGKETKYNKFIAIICIEGFREVKVIGMLQKFERAGIIGINKEKDLIIPYDL